MWLWLASREKQTIPILGYAIFISSEGGDVCMCVCVRKSETTLHQYSKIENAMPPPKELFSHTLVSDK